jgi:hypothetical protein
MNDDDERKMCGEYNDRIERKKERMDETTTSDREGGVDELTRFDDRRVALKVLDVLDEEMDLVSRLNGLDAV